MNKNVRDSIDEDNSENPETTGVSLRAQPRADKPIIVRLPKDRGIKKKSVRLVPKGKSSASCPDRGGSGQPNWGPHLCRS